MREVRGGGMGLKLDAKGCGRSELWEHQPVREPTDVLRGARREAERREQLSAPVRQALRLYFMVILPQFSTGALLPTAGLNEDVLFLILF